MMRTNPIDHQDRAGTSRQGRLNASYDQLVRVFGQPGDPIAEDKSHAEWVLQTPHGVAAIYDYGDGHECEPGCQRDPRPDPQDPVELYIDWSVGGHNPETFGWVRRHFANCNAAS